MLQDVSKSHNVTSEYGKQVRKQGYSGSNKEASETLCENASLRAWAPVLDVAIKMHSQISDWRMSTESQSLD